MVSRRRKAGIPGRLQLPWHSLALLTVLASCVAMANAGPGDISQAADPPNVPPSETPESDKDQPAVKPAQPDEEQRATDRESLIKLIRERAEAARKAAAEGKPAAQPGRLAVPPEIRKARRNLQRQRLGQTPTTRPAGKAAGCGKKGAQALTPPPPDAPQPKFVCKQPVAELDTVWKGQKVTFQFVIANEGEGPLKINLKRG